MKRVNSSTLVLQDEVVFLKQGYNMIIKRINSSDFLKKLSYVRKAGSKDY